MATIPHPRGGQLQLARQRNVRSAQASACATPRGLKPPRYERPSSAAAGQGALGISRSGGRSVVSRAYATSPLRLLTPRNHGHAAWVYTSSYGGGLVDGDRLALDVDVDAGASAFISTQASTKIYKSPAGTSAAMRARVGAGGLLVVAPDPVVCFAASRFSQIQQVDLDDDASLVLVDWVTSGRRASGERWAFEDYHAQIVVRLGGRLIVHDALALRAADGDLAGRLGRFDVLASVVIAGRALRAEAAALVSHVSRTPIVRRADRLVAATPLAAGDAGCMLRIAGRSVEDVGRTIREILGFVPPLLGDDPWTRKW